MSFGKKFIAIGLSLIMNLFFWIPFDYGIKNIPEKSQNAVRVMSYNVRCANDLYGSVRVRSRLVIKQIKEYMPDSFGVQEATTKWMKILQKKLGDYYDCVCTYREEGKGAEASAVFYLKDKYSLKDSGTIWLSDAPDVVGSKYEDAGCPRITTWAVLENKETGEAYTHINTHLDHVGDEARVKQAKILCGKIRELMKDCKTLICTGDFNAGESSIVYDEMLRTLIDSKYSAGKSDEGITYHDYGRVEGETEPIDFIFTTEDIQVNRYKIIDEMVWGMFPSDHYGISVDFNM